MKSEDIRIPPGELRSFGRALYSMERFSDDFTKATGLELDLIHALHDRWESVAARVRNPLCQQLTHNEPACQRCAETFTSQLQRADEAGIGVFTSCSCFAGQRFSVALLTDYPDSKIYLLAGRVPVYDKHSPASTKSSSLSHTTPLTEKKYAAALELAAIMLPQLQREWKERAQQNALGMSATIRQACHYIQTHYAENCHVSDVAQHCGVSSDWLSRHFKKDSGHSLPEYIRELRLEQAAALLLDSDTPITKICFDSGFQSVSQFNRLFHEEYAMSPSDYRHARPDA